MISKLIILAIKIAQRVGECLLMLNKMYERFLIQGAFCSQYKKSKYTIQCTSRQFYLIAVALYFIFKYNTVTNYFNAVLL